MIEHEPYSSNKSSDIDDLEWYNTNISEPSGDIIEEYTEQTEIALEHLKESCNISPMNIRFVYGDWTDERAAELIEDRETSYTSAYSFHPDFHSWLSQPTIFVKSSTNYEGWEDGFRNAIIHEVGHQLFLSWQFLWVHRPIRFYCI